MITKQPALFRNSAALSDGTRRALGLLIAALLIFLSGCVNVDVINLSESSVRVLIRLPDAPGGYTRLIRAADTTSTFSSYGGRIIIQTLPDQEYRNLLETLRDEISRRLFEERSTLTAQDVAQLVDRLEQIDQLVEEMADDETSCTVSAPDFSSVTAVINWDTVNSKWRIDCSVAADES